MAKTNKTPKATENSDSKPAVAEVVNTPPETPAKEANKDARMWAMFCHLAGLAGLIIPVVGNIVTPLVLWQIKKDDFPFVDEQGKEAVNFQISMSIYGVVAAVLIFACVGVVLLPAVYLVDLIFLLIAAVKANDGHHYHYPLTIRFVK
jgi:uncharacterized Tic20 family protein